MLVVGLHLGAEQVDTCSRVYLVKWRSVAVVVLLVRVGARSTIRIPEPLSAVAQVAAEMPLRMHVGVVRSQTMTITVYFACMCGS